MSRKFFRSFLMFMVLLLFDRSVGSQPSSVTVLTCVYVVTACSFSRCSVRVVQGHGHGSTAVRCAPDLWRDRTSGGALGRSGVRHSHLAEGARCLRSGRSPGSSRAPR